MSGKKGFHRLTHIGSRMIKILAITFVSLAIFAVSVATTILWKPQLLIHSKTFDWALKKLKIESLGLTLDPQKIISVESISFFKKKFTLDLNNICFDPPESPDVHICVGKLAVVFQIDFSSYPFNLTRMDHFELTGGTFEKPPEIRRGTFYGTVIDREPGKNKNHETTFGKWTLTLHSQAHLHLSDQIIDLNADFIGKYPEKKIQAQINALMAIPSRANPSRTRQGVVTRLSTKSCLLEAEPLPLQEGSDASGAIRLDCSIVAQWALPSNKKYSRIQLPRSTSLRVKGDLKTTFPFSMTDPLEGKVSVVLNPILHPLFHGQGQIDADISGTLEKFPEKINLYTALDFKWLIPKFARAVQLLETTDWAIPAPLNDLDGTLEARVSGTFDLQTGKVPLTLTSRLQSQNQKLHFEGKGVLELKKNPVTESYQPNLTFDVTLSDILFAFPRLALAEPPRLLPDPRIQTVKKQKAEQAQRMAPSVRARHELREVLVQDEPGFHYTLTVRTPENSPIRILSNLAQAPVPLHLALQIKDTEPTQGVLNIARFPLELFKRKAELERFTYQIKKNDDTHPIDGALKVSYTDYTIRVEIFGTAEKPKLKLTSDPPLSENQAYAVLLFGRTLDDLDATEGESVGETQAAVADGAIGLASLYMLASTPIESLAYDSETGAVSAKVRIGEGTSLNIGGSSDQKFVGIRRRLSRAWTLETDLTHFSNSAETLGTGVSAFLRWSNRY